MKDKIAFVAIGQAGGNIGQLFEERGFSVLYLNTSEEDLSTLEDAKFKYHITGGEGCNKDRRKAKQLVIDDYDSIATEMDAKIKQISSSWYLPAVAEQVLVLVRCSAIC